MLSQHATRARDSVRPLSRVQPQLPAQVGEPPRVHGPAVLQQGTELCEPGLGEDGARPMPATPDPDQPAVEQALDSERDLRLAPVWAGVPGAQEDAVREARVLAEVAAELAADQLALAGRRRRRACPSYARRGVFHKPTPGAGDGLEGGASPRQRRTGRGRGEPLASLCAQPSE
jgi:hypothetical protein